MPGNGQPVDPSCHSSNVNNPQHAADWVTYDITSGIPAEMEVGNEEDIALAGSNTAADDPRFQPYIDGFNAQAQAMHAAAQQANTSVRVVGPACTNEYYCWNRDLLGMFLKGAGNRYGSGQVDAVSAHYYAGSSWAEATMPAGPAVMTGTTSARCADPVMVRGAAKWRPPSTERLNAMAPR